MLFCYNAPKIFVGYGMTGAKKLIPLDQFVFSRLGAECLSKLEYQARGGDNNSKGNNHESFFSTYQLAKNYVENPDDDIEIRSQERAFVDDVVVLNLSKNSKYSYQLKDSKRVYWNKSKGISPYFRDQYKIDKEFYKIDCSKTILVLAQERVYKLRKKDIPKKIESHTKCVLFKNSDSANRILMENSDFMNVVSQFCVYPEEPDKVEVVLQCLLGAWVTHNKTESKMSELIGLARKSANPDFFINSQINNSLSLEFTEVLDNIDGLSYKIVNGYLNYNVKSFSGSVRVRVESHEFNVLCETIVEENPKDALTLFRFLMKVGT